MPKSIARVYSKSATEAVLLLGGLIRVARQERGYTAQSLAERAGISRGMLQRIEKGDPKCEMGVVFELAVIVGVPLFQADEQELRRQRQELDEKRALLPKSVRQTKPPVNDDF